MTVALRQLMQRHNVRSLRLPPLPLAEPVDAQIVKVRGIAATGDVDLDRTWFRHGCWPKLDPGQIKLLVNHDREPQRRNDRDDRRRPYGPSDHSRHVTDKDAMRLPALRISAMVAQVHHQRPDSASFVGEVVRVSDVNEMSLSTTPANRQCLFSTAGFRHFGVQQRGAARQVQVTSGDGCGAARQGRVR